jgi:hypothetical protein
MSIEVKDFVSNMNGDKSCPINPLATHGVYVKGNMASIATTIPIDISKTLGIVANVFIRADYSPEEISTYTTLFKEFCNVFFWSYEEMSRIDP